MSTNRVSASMTDATDLFATVGPHATIRDFASIFEALGSVQRGEDGDPKCLIGMGCTKSEISTAEKSTSGRNALKEDPQDRGVSPTDDPIPSVLSSPAPTPILETKLTSEDVQPRGAIGTVSEVPKSADLEIPTDSLEAGSEVVGTESKVTAKSTRNGEVDTGLAGIQDNSTVTIDSEKVLSSMVADDPRIAAGDEPCSKPLPSKYGIRPFERAAKTRSQDGARTEVLTDDPELIERTSSTVGATRTAIHEHALDVADGVHEIPKGASPRTTTKERGTNKPAALNQSTVATGIVAWNETVVPATQLTDNKSELQKSVPPPFEQPTNNALPNECGLERASRGSGPELISEVPVSPISPNLEHWVRSTEVQRGVLNLDGKAEMSVHLRSQASGSLEVRTVVQDHKVEASIVSSEGYAVNASPEAIGALRDRLATHALTLETLSFQNSAMESSASQDGRRQNEAPKDVAARRTSNAEDLMQKSSMAGLQGHSGVLNVRV